MKTLKSQYTELFSNRRYKKSFIFGVLILIVGGLFSGYVISFANDRESVFVGDLILDNIPTMNLFLLRIVVPLGTFILAGVIIFLTPKKLPLSLKSFGLLYITRAFFISLTYLKASPEKIFLNNVHPILQVLPYKGNDLFFSGHVAFPLMIALLFWKEKKIRVLFITLSVISGAITLLSKGHYSIDVFAAPFITYGVYKISEKLFGNDLNF